MSRAKCHLVKIDDEWVRVQGERPISAEAQAALAELVRAVRNHEPSPLPADDGSAAVHVVNSGQVGWDVDAP